VDAYYNLIGRCKPKSIVFTEGASYEEDIFSRVALQIGVPTVRVQYGRAGVLHNGYRNMAYSKMLMWGDGFIERLKRYSPAPSYVVTGSHILELQSKEVESDYLRIKKIIGGRQLVTLVTQPICATICEQDYMYLVNCVKYFLDHSKEYFVIVRKHPADQSNIFSVLSKKNTKNLLITDSQEMHILSILKSSKYIIGFYSTMLSEAVAVGVLPIVLPLRNSDSIFPAPENEGAGIKVINVDDLDNEINSVLSANISNLYFDGMKKFRKKYFYKMDGMSAQRICDEIIRI
jgi:UDP-N-acetylglucosamine 2-epimerase